jgi:hypothetical protein
MEACHDLRRPDPHALRRHRAPLTLRPAPRGRRRRPQRHNRVPSTAGRGAIAPRILVARGHRLRRLGRLGAARARRPAPTMVGVSRARDRDPAERGVDHRLVVVSHDGRVPVRPGCVTQPRGRCPRILRQPHCRARFPGVRTAFDRAGQGEIAGRSSGAILDAGSQPDRRVERIWEADWSPELLLPTAARGTLTACSGAWGSARSRSPGTLRRWREAAALRREVEQLGRHPSVADTSHPPTAAPGRSSTRERASGVTAVMRIRSTGVSRASSSPRPFTARLPARWPRDCPKASRGTVRS